MNRIRPACRHDAAQIAEIYSQGIAQRQATFETAPRTAADIDAWIERSSCYPLIVAVDEANVVLGWAGLSSYRERECYARIAEFSVYLAHSVRRLGLGQQLLTALIEFAAECGFSKLLSRVFTFNHASRRLCQRCGFREVGVYQRHAQLDGRWLDVVIVERLIERNHPRNEQHS